MQDDTRMIGRMMTRMITKTNVATKNNKKNSALETGIILPTQDDWPKSRMISSCFGPSSWPEAQA